MREADERRSEGQGHELAALAEAAQDGDGGNRTQYSAQGPLPAVAATAGAHGPSASDLAYGAHDAAFAPHKPDEVKDEIKSTPQLFLDFAAFFPESGKLLKASPDAMKFIKECSQTGARFGGYAEDGPVPSTWPYTLHNTVYIPKARTDGLEAMSDYLFELNNAVRAPKFDVLRKEAAKGAKGTLTNASYARKVVELEVEGMLKLGEVWLEMKKSAGKEEDATWKAEDHHFYLEQYKAYKDGTKTKDDIVNDVLHSRYTQGHSAGKTVEENYKDQYDSISARGPE